MSIAVFGSCFTGITGFYDFIAKSYNPFIALFAMSLALGMVISTTVIVAMLMSEIMKLHK
ncbi:MAG: hypothetical protein LBF86_08610 [Helicobacteraceae bacterium]|nr:hypothetical protein [Helicobacteraceae bacterium]